MSNYSINTTKYNRLSLFQYQMRSITKISLKSQKHWSFMELHLLYWCQNEFSIESRTGRAIRAYSTNMHKQHRRSAPEGRSKSGDGRMDGWKRIKLSVINNTAWSSRSSFYAGTVAHPCLARSKILTSARNDSINNASSTIALNMYPV